MQRVCEGVCSSNGDWSGLAMAARSDCLFLYLKLVRCFALHCLVVRCGDMSVRYACSCSFSFSLTTINQWP